MNTSRRTLVSSWDSEPLIIEPNQKKFLFGKPYGVLYCRVSKVNLWENAFLVELFKDEKTEHPAQTNLMFNGNGGWTDSDLGKTDQCDIIGKFIMDSWLSVN